MRVRWVDPSPENSCDLCLHHAGWVMDSGYSFQLPAHEHCNCYWQPSPDAVLTVWAWDEMPPKILRRWVGLAAYYIRFGTPLAGLLGELNGQAIAYNEEWEMKKSKKQRKMDRGREAVLVAESLFLSTPLSLAATDKPREYRATLITAGQIVNRLGEFDDIFVEATAIETAVNAGAFEGLACFVDHSERYGMASLHELFGVWHGVTYDAVAQCAVGTLRVYSNAETDPIADRLDQMLSDAAEGIPIPNAGVSLTFFGIWRVRDNYDEPRRLSGFKKIESGDLVFTPAADGRILEALSAIRSQRTSEPAELAGGESSNMLLTNEQVRTHLAASGLPVEAIEGLAAGGYENIEALDAAIKVVRAGLVALAPPGIKGELETVLAAITQQNETIEQLQTAVGALVEDGTIEMSASPRQQSGIQMLSGAEQAQEHLDFFFGVKDAPLPPGNMRRLDSLYVAMTGDVNFRGVADPERIQFAGANTTDLPSMAANAMNKVVTQQFNSAALLHYRWYELVTDVVANDGSVQDMNLITLGGVGDLPTVAESGPYTELSMGDVEESASFNKKGGYVGITLEMFRNSQIAKIQAVPKTLAIAAVRTRSAAVAALFTVNSGVGPTLAQDSKALFHADHNNILTTAFSQAAWEAAQAEMFAHVELTSGKALAMFPRYALMNVNNFKTAQGIFGYGDGKPTSYNPHAMAHDATDPRPIALIVPDWTDVNDWGYIADPLAYSVIQMSYAQNMGGGSHPQPELFSVTSPTAGLMFTNDVLPVKVRDWFAVGVNGPRGIGKRNVA